MHAHTQFFRAVTTMDNVFLINISKELISYECGMSPSSTDNAAQGKLNRKERPAASYAHTGNTSDKFALNKLTFLL